MKQRNRKAFKREEVKLMIVQALLTEMTRQWDACMTVADFARALKRTPSTKLRDMVKELVIEGILQEAWQKYPGIAGKRCFYSIPDGQRTNVLRTMRKSAGQSPRHIRINGKQLPFEGMTS